jgi:hypothetical protein
MATHHHRRFLSFTRHTSLSLSLHELVPNASMRAASFGWALYCSGEMDNWVYFAFKNEVCKNDVIDLSL